MAIVNSAATFAGVGAQIIQNIGTVVTTAASPQTVRVPAAGSISPAVARGYLRAKIYNQTVAASFTVLLVQAGDGTNLITVAEFAPAVAVVIAATTWVDVLDDFLIDTSTAGGGATGTLIFGGATFFNFIFTVTGAGGSLSVDCEVIAEP
jgi:hypothetical protein